MDNPAHTPGPDLDRLRRAVAPLAERHGWRLVVLFGSVARTGRGRDLDLAILPASTPDLLEQGRWWSELDALDSDSRWGQVDLLVLGPATSPLTAFEVMRHGRPLYEQERGLFDREHDRAFFLYADSQWIRDQAREALYADAPN